jgi:hypothetical protein
MVWDNTKGNVSSMESKRDNQEDSGIAPRHSGILQIIRSNIIAIVIITALTTGFFLLRTSPSDIGSLEELQALISSGQPVLVEFYSNT